MHETTDIAWRADNGGEDYSVKIELLNQDGETWQTIDHTDPTVCTNSATVASDSVCNFNGSALSNHGYIAGDSPELLQVKVTLTNSAGYVTRCAIADTPVLQDTER